METKLANNEESGRNDGGKKGTGGTLQVLMIEDDGNDQALFSFAAGRSGLDMKLRTAQTVADGINFLRAGHTGGGGKLDLVLLDLVMPGDSGFDFLRWWSGSRWRPIPVAVLSGSTYEREQMAALKLGAAAFLLKPNSMEEWDATVLRVWELGMEGRQRNRRQLPARSELSGGQGTSPFWAST